jgi:hypothetical protein
MHPRAKSIPGTSMCRLKLLGLIVAMGASAFAVEFMCLGLIRLIEWTRAKRAA